MIPMRNELLIVLLLVGGICSLWAIDVSSIAMNNNLQLENIGGFRDASQLYHMSLILNTFILIVFSLSNLWVLKQKSYSKVV